MLQNPIRQASRYGQSIWCDGLLSPEEFRRWIHEEGIRGATTNPTIFEKAFSSGEDNPSMARLLKTHAPEEIYNELAVQQVSELADLFRPVFEETESRDGFVSIEVNPLFAYDTGRTLEEARELWRRVARKNVMVKVPATREGIPAIETLIAEGINVNVTLIFSIERYREVMGAYLAGLEKRRKEGKLVGGISSVASFFVSRVDTAVDKRLEEKIKNTTDPKEAAVLRALAGQAAVANSKLAYREFEKLFSSPRFKELEAAGAFFQRPLWASTGTKNPVYSDVLYVESLVGPQTVNTLPPATLFAFRDHGVAANRLTQGVEESRLLVERLEKHGISLSEVTRELETQGVRLFSESYEKILQYIRSKK
jgi:transaldolase